jgi:hypothetical protein
MRAPEVTGRPKGKGNFVPRDVFTRKWIVGTEFDGIRPRLKILNLQTGAIEPGDFTNLGRYVQFDVPTIMLKRITFELSCLSRVPASEYTQAFGLPHWAHSGQTVFELQLPTRKVVIPCQVLACALFGVSVHNRRRLLLPTGLSDPRIVSGRRATISKAPKDAEKRSSEWVQEHLSARASWTSIYAAALEGTLDMSLPEAQVDVRFTGVRQEGAFFVTRLSISTLRSSDHVRSPGKKVYEFRKPGTPRPRVGSLPFLKPAQLAGLVCVQEGVSNAQWAAVSALLLDKHGNLRSPVRARRSLNLALRRYGSGCDWEAAGSKSARTQRAAAYVINRLRRLNRLEAAIAALREAERSGA